MQLAYDRNWEWWASPQTIPHPYALWTTEELLDDMASYGINAVKIWFKGDIADGTGSWCWSPEGWDVEERGDFSCAFGEYDLEDMDAVFSHPAIDVYILRLVNTCWSIQEHNSCTLSTYEDCKWSGKTFANEPTYWIASTLFARFGHLSKTILIGDWEQDWSIRGQNSRGYDERGVMRFPWADAPDWWRTTCVQQGGEQECGEQLVAERYEYVRKVIKRRQDGIVRARLEHPDQALKIEGYVIFNRYPGNTDETQLGYSVLDIVNELPSRSKPDRVAISFWDRDTTITEALDWAQQRLNWPRHRFFVDEFGEWRERDQYERIWNEGRRARCWGVNLLSTWMYRQTWCGYTKGGALKNHGLFYQLNCPKPSDFPQQPVQFGEPRPGMQAVQDLVNFIPTESECAEVMALPPTRSKSVVIREDEKTYPWEVYDEEP
jgi:hypothetical protein